MATTEIIRGGNVRMHWGAGDPITYTNPIENETSSSISVASDTVTADVKGNNGWGSSISVLNRWTSSIELQCARGSDTQALVETAAFARNKVYLQWTIVSDDAGNDGTMTGSGYITSYDISGEVAGTVTVSISVEGDGELVVA